MKLSYSAVSMYQECGYKYKLHYIDRIRPTTTASPLIFGSAIGETVEAMLNGDPIDYELYFTDKLHKSAYESKIKYSKSDFDKNLLTESFIYAVEEKYNVEIKDLIKNGPQCDLDQEIYNELSLFTLTAKGVLMLGVFDKWAKDNIKEVHGTEIKVELTNDDGDSFIGYLDFDVTLNDGKRYIMDLKTSSNPNTYYKDDSAEKSVQLTIYSHEQQNPNVGYIVLDKKIRVREPRVRFKEVYGEITEEQEQEVFGAIDEVLHGIRAEEFEKNTDSCNNFSGCVYRAFCKHGNMKDLEKK